MTTNREKLNQMSNEELATLLGNADCCFYCNYGDMNFIECTKRDDCTCKDGILQWLNQESE